MSIFTTRFTTILASFFFFALCEETSAYHWGNYPCPPFNFIPCSGPKSPYVITPEPSTAPSMEPSSIPPSIAPTVDNDEKEDDLLVLALSEEEEQVWCCFVGSDCESECGFHDGIQCPEEYEECRPEAAEELDYIPSGEVTGEMFVHGFGSAGAERHHCRWATALLVGLLTGALLLIQ